MRHEIRRHRRSCSSNVLVRFCADARGVAAVEFGLLVPLLFIMFIGTLEIGQAVGLDRRVSMATASTADLIARDKTASNTTLDGVMQIVQHLLSPYDASGLEVGVIHVTADPANAAVVRVAWSYSHNGATVPGRCQTYTMPVGLLGAGASAVIVEGVYHYEPLIVSHFLNNRIEFKDKATVSPRNSCVSMAGKNDSCNLSCP